MMGQPYQTVIRPAKLPDDLWLAIFYKQAPATLLQYPVYFGVKTINSMGCVHFYIYIITYFSHGSEALYTGP